MRGQAQVCAWVAWHGWRTGWVKHGKDKLLALEADITSNVTSTTNLCAAGWKFVQDNDRFEAGDVQSAGRAADIADFAGSLNTAST